MEPVNPDTIEYCPYGRFVRGLGSELVINPRSDRRKKVYVRHGLLCVVIVYTCVGVIHDKIYQK